MVTCGCATQAIVILQRDACRMQHKPDMIGKLRANSMAHVFNTQVCVINMSFVVIRFASVALDANTKSLFQLCAILDQLVVVPLKSVAIVPLTLGSAKSEHVVGIRPL